MAKASLIFENKTSRKIFSFTHRLKEKKKEFTNNLSAYVTSISMYKGKQKKDTSDSKKWPDSLHIHQLK